MRGRDLAPRLRRRDIVVFDNLKAHLAPEVRLLIEARGATVRYLPPYVNSSTFRD